MLKQGQLIKQFLIQTDGIPSNSLEPDMNQEPKY